MSCSNLNYLKIGWSEYWTGFAEIIRVDRRKIWKNTKVKIVGRFKNKYQKKFKWEI